MSIQVADPNWTQRAKDILACPQCNGRLELSLDNLTISINWFKISVILPVGLAVGSIFKLNIITFIRYALLGLYTLYCIHLWCDDEILFHGWLYCETFLWRIFPHLVQNIGQTKPLDNAEDAMPFYENAILWHFMTYVIRHKMS